MPHTIRPHLPRHCTYFGATVKTAHSPKLERQDTVTIEHNQTASLKRVYMSRAQLAQHFNVTERALSKIIKRKRWRKMKNMGTHAIYSLLETDLTDEGDGRRTYGQASRAIRDRENSSPESSPTDVSPDYSGDP